MITIANSTLSGLICETKQALRDVQSLTTPDEAGDRTCGTAMHAAMEVLLNTADVPAALKRFDTEYKEWSAEHCLPQTRRRYGQDVEVQNPRRWENTRPILAEVFQRTPLRGVLQHLVAEHVEIAFRYPLAVGVDYYGRMDAVFRDNFGVWSVFDLKTTRGALDGPWWHQWVLDAGLTGYCWAASQLVGAPVRRIYILGIDCGELPQTSRLKKDGKPYTCGTHKLPYEDCLMQHVQCGVQMFARSDEAVAQWQSEAVRKAAEVQRIRDTYADEAQIASAPQDGTFVGHCRFCDFQPFCAAGRPLHLMRTMLLARERWLPDAAGEVA